MKGVLGVWWGRGARQVEKGGKKGWLVAARGGLRKRAGVSETGAPPLFHGEPLQQRPQHKKHHITTTNSSCRACEAVCTTSLPSTVASAAALKSKRATSTPCCCLCDHQSTKPKQPQQQQQPANAPPFGSSSILSMERGPSVVRMMSDTACVQ